MNATSLLAPHHAVGLLLVVSVGFLVLGLRASAQGLELSLIHI
jgi:hypothetical protein